MTDVRYFPWKFFKVNDRPRYIYVDIHDGKCSLYGPHSKGRKPLQLELVLTLTLSLTPSYP